MIDELTAVTSAPITLELSAQDRAQVNHTFQHWFAAVTKRAVPDLDQRVQQFKLSLSKLALVVEFSYAGSSGTLLATAAGQEAETLAQLKAGTLWFDGWPHLERSVLCVIQD